jgi:predicted nuclease of predicted toxin-antitoxin system
MKFIVDAQLPKSLSDLLKYRGHDSIHTLELPDQNASSDKFITNLALEEGRIVITKDNDFLESYLLKSEPNKLIVVRTGNISNQLLLKIFDDNLSFIELIISRSNLIEITSSEIAEHG